MISSSFTGYTYLISSFNEKDSNTKKKKKCGMITKRQISTRDKMNQHKIYVSTGTDTIELF